jgi:hypothetical protein
MSVKASIIWLKIACVITILTGVICALASHPATDAAWLFLFDLLKWPLDGNPGVFDANTHAVNAVLGGTMVGWGLLMYFLASSTFLLNVPGLPRLMLIALCAWFVVDCTGSLLANLPGNVVLNTGFLVMFVPPLVKLMQARY